MIIPLVTLAPVIKVRVNAGHCVHPPPIFSLYSSPTWIQMLSVHYMLKSQRNARLVLI